ncbi:MULTISPECIES: gas vesicle protein GvpG [unclassified Tolypothrix]|uniref:gas vesicle protein GvpG n=1 Tax=unclassified Tolypothrix TaxID=2649714 RepID=UPI0005F76799|nr:MULTISPECIES: gas vesicle protein GvpG [unclassified Tolypothrix]MBE9082178.1 gas vesicle protein GvpG [Tolypothrix sp. LEGE 11397]UYD24668.1 gas vesicle protein GvpG [Tolypothrix sp. PCC 7712]UYD33103.1 gas vesicle protein GvpG [Tolypothrix sp. PCC 7601]BAY90506.1 Gas vesicle G [Microchaete diplosiphon NIES-3275]
MLGKILLFPVMGPISGLMWIGEQIQERTDTEFDAQENLHKQLLSLQLSFDIGEISEEDFEEQEEELLLKIQALEEEKARLEAESIEDEEDEVEPTYFIAEVEEDKVLAEAFRGNKKYEDNENLVLSP